jgi:hypothetical protein
MRLLAALALACGAFAAHAQPTEAAVKAAFLPKFARYVEWPAAAQPQAGQPFQLCIVGRDPFGRVLDQYAANEQIDGHSVAVRRVQPGNDTSSCHLAFVDGANAHETARLLSQLRGQPVLTITDERAGSARGMIHFAIEGGRVRFYIDEAAAAQHGLSISSRLLALAIGVRQR